MVIDTGSEDEAIAIIDAASTAAPACPEFSDRGGPGWFELLDVPEWGMGCRWTGDRLGWTARVDRLLALGSDHREAATRCCGDLRARDTGPGSGLSAMFETDDGESTVQQSTVQQSVVEAGPTLAREWIDFHARLPSCGHSEDHVFRTTYESVPIDPERAAAVDEVTPGCCSCRCD